MGIPMTHRREREAKPMDILKFDIIHAIDSMY